MATKTTKGGSYEYTDKPKVKNSPSSSHNSGVPGASWLTKTTRKNMKEGKPGEVKYATGVSTAPSDAGNLAGNIARIKTEAKLKSYTKNPLKK